MDFARLLMLKIVPIRVRTNPNEAHSRVNRVGLIFVYERAGRGSQPIGDQGATGKFPYSRWTVAELEPLR
jgi:hypothetical protein